MLEAAKPRGRFIIFPVLMSARLDEAGYWAIYLGMKYFPNARHNAVHLGTMRGALGCPHSAGRMLRIDGIR